LRARGLSKKKKKKIDQCFEKIEEKKICKRPSAQKIFIFNKNKYLHMVISMCAVLFYFWKIIIDCMQANSHGL